MIRTRVTGGDPATRGPLAKGIIIDHLMHKHSLVFAKDLPAPKKKIRAPEDLLPDLEDDD